MALLKTDAIVLRARDFGEADKIVTLLTREEGKLQAVAKGARRPRNRMVGATEVFTYGDFLLFRGRNLDTISQCEIRESFRTLREDLTKMAYASYLTELAGEVIREKDRNDGLFLLLLATLHLLTEAEDPEVLTKVFEFKLLSLAGYRPRLEECVECGRPVEGSPVRFTMAGGVLCRECVSAESPIVIISRGTLEMMKRLLEVDPRRAHVLKLSPDIAAELGRLARNYIAYHLERRLKSLEFLDMIRGTPDSSTR